MYANPFGVGMANGREDIVNEILLPVYSKPFGTGNRTIEFDQAFCEGLICGAHGYLSGVVPAGNSFLGYQVSEEKELRIRFGAHFVLDEKMRFRDIYALADILSAFDTLGRDLIKEAQE